MRTELPAFRTLTTLLAVAAGLVAAPANAVPLNVNVSNQTGTATKSETSIDVNPTDPSNLVIVSHSGDSDQAIDPDDSFAVFQTFWSKDGGATWNSVPLDDIDDGFESDLRFDPSVAFDADGNLYVAYGVSLAAGVDDIATDIDESVARAAMVVAHSSDGGESYDQFTVVATTADTMDGRPGNDKWHLATGPDKLAANEQALYIAWTQNLETEQRIVLSGSFDEAASFFADPVLVSDDVQPGKLFADPAVDANGNVFVSWHDFTKTEDLTVDNNRVMVDVSQDNGATFGADNLVTEINPEFAAGLNGLKVPVTAQPTRGVHVGPVLDADQSDGAFANRLYEAYVDLDGEYEFGVKENTDIFVRYSDDEGAIWSDPVRVNDDTTTNSQFLPWIDVDPIKGLVGVVWYDARDDIFNELVEVFFSFSQDGGDTLSPNILLSDIASGISGFANGYLEYIGLAGFDHVFKHSVWSPSEGLLAGGAPSENLDIITTHIEVDEPSALLPWFAAIATFGAGAMRLRRAVR